MRLTSFLLLATIGIDWFLKQLRREIHDLFGITLRPHVPPEQLAAFAIALLLLAGKATSPATNIVFGLIVGFGVYWLTCRSGSRAIERGLRARPPDDETYR